MLLRTEYIDSANNPFSKFGKRRKLNSLVICSYERGTKFWPHKQHLMTLSPINYSH